ncbi:hypothetical protein NDU88_000447, partial [Pleurodeles waltl]
LPSDWSLSCSLCWEVSCLLGCLSPLSASLSLLQSVSWEVSPVCLRSLSLAVSAERSRPSDWSLSCSLSAGRSPVCLR